MDDAEKYFNYGKAYHNEGRFTEAIEAFRKALELKPIWADAYYYRGLAYLKMDAYNMLENAINNFYYALTIDPFFAEAYFARGIIYLKKGSRDKAIEDFSQAIRLKPDYAKAYFYRGLVHYQKDDFDEAIEDFNDVVKFKRDFTGFNFYYLRSKAYKAKGEIDKANLNLNLSDALKNVKDNEIDEDL